MTQQTNPSDFNPETQSTRQGEGSPVPPWALLLGAGALAVIGLTRRSKSSSSRSFPGARSSDSDLLTFKSATQKLGSKGYTASSTFRVAASAQHAYELWRDFAGFPRFMPHLESVRIIDRKRSVWTAKGPTGTPVSWTAEITDDTPGKRISWKSLPKSEITNAGTVEFRESPDGRGTYVTAQINYSLPGGPLAKALIASFGKSPDFVVKEDLRRFKALLEAGEVSTTVGQSHGPRSVRSKAHEFLLRETSNMPQPQAS